MLKSKDLWSGCGIEQDQSLPLFVDFALFRVPLLSPHDAAERGRHLNAAKKPKFASSPHPEELSRRISAHCKNELCQSSPSRCSRLTCQIQDMSELCSSKIGIWRFPRFYRVCQRVSNIAISTLLRALKPVLHILSCTKNYMICTILSMY